MRALLGAIGLVLMLSAGSAVGEEAFELEEGFERLDNGKDLAGWLAKGKDNWSVVDGAIHLDASKKGGSLFCEKRHSRDCVIRLQFRATHAADSGVFIHGAQFQVRDYPNSLRDTRRFAPHAKGPGEWNALELDVSDGVAAVRLNGHLIVPKWKIGDQPDRGIGLQREKGDFDFRYIRIREK